MKYFIRDNINLESQIDTFFIELSDYNDKYYNGELSVILLGSLSRGEATWIESDNGEMMVSDIEFFTVYPNNFINFEEFSKEIENTMNKVFSNQRSSLFHIDNTFIARSALPRMEKKLITYDAKKFGKCVVGNDTVKLLPDINIDNINMYDIRDILTHRAFSVLYYGYPLKNSGRDDEYCYLLAKNSLDLMTVLLAENGLLASGFINRFNEIKNLPIDEELKKYFSYCLNIKLGIPNNENYTIEEMERLFVSTTEDLYKKFRVPFKNLSANFIHIIRRLLGQVKRSLRYRHFVSSKLLSRLIYHLQNGTEISRNEILDNLVLNGYPT